MDASFPLPPLSQPTRMLRLKEGLVDGQGRAVTDLWISVTERCDLACLRCRSRPPVPGSRSEPPALRRTDLLRLARTFATLGIREICLTGGEPLLRRDLELLVAGLSPEVDGRVHLTTHGLRLARRARALRDAGLQAVSVSLDAAERGRFADLTGRDGLARVLAGLEAARSAGLETTLEAVILRGWNDDQILPLVRLALAEGMPIRFFEFKPRPENGGREGAFMPADEILGVLREGLGLELKEEIPPDGEAGPARRFRLSGTAGEVGLFPALTGGFCGPCNRVRLSARGELETCRFGRPPTDLLAALKDRASQEELVQLIRAALKGKPACPPARAAGLPHPGPGRRQVGG